MFIEGFTAPSGAAATSAVAPLPPRESTTSGAHKFPCNLVSSGGGDITFIIIICFYQGAEKAQSALSVRSIDSRGPVITFYYQTKRIVFSRPTGLDRYKRTRTRERSSTSHQRPRFRDQGGLNVLSQRKEFALISPFIVAFAANPRLIEFYHIDTQSTRQKSHCVSTGSGHRSASFLSHSRIPLDPRLMKRVSSVREE